MKLFFSILILLALGGCNSSPPKPLTLHILHVNDIHSHLDEEAIKLKFDGIDVKVDAGGYAQIASVTDSLKTENTLILNAGDALQGTLYYTLFKGEADAKMMNMVGFDAFVLGNHEFDDGDDNLYNFLDELNSSVLAANVVPKSDCELYNKWSPYIIRYFDGEAVGIIGIDTSYATKESSNPSDDIKFFDEIKTVQKYVDILESMGINKIILLSHYGYENDINLSLHVRGVDVIVGGHSHTLLGSFDDLALKSTDSYPKKSTSADNRPVCIVQAYAYAKIVGDLHVSFDKDGVLSSCEGVPILMLSDNFKTKNSNGEYEDVNSSFYQKIEKIIQDRDDVKIVKKDEQTQNILQEYKLRVDEKKKEIIATADKKIAHIRVPTHSYADNEGDKYPLGSEVAPLVSKAFYNRVNLCDAVILNAGALRTDIPEGNISIETVYTLLPFSNTLYLLSMSADEIHQVLEEAMQSVIKNGSDGSFAYAYALRYDVDMREEFGNRVQNIEILDKKSQEFVALQDDKTYNITTISYLGMGKDGYKTFLDVASEDTYFDYANSFVVYLKELHVRGEDVEKLPQKMHCIKSYKE
jgi:5'-nucleotidase